MDKNAFKSADEIYDIVYYDIMHCWHLLPKDDFLVALFFITSSAKYLETLSHICEYYEQNN